MTLTIKKSSFLGFIFKKIRTPKIFTRLMQNVIPGISDLEKVFVIERNSGRLSSRGRMMRILQRISCNLIVIYWSIARFNWLMEWNPCDFPQDEFSC